MASVDAAFSIVIVILLIILIDQRWGGIRIMIMIRIRSK